MARRNYQYEKRQKELAKKKKKEEKRLRKLAGGGNEDQTDAPAPDGELKAPDDSPI